PNATVTPDSIPGSGIVDPVSVSGAELLSLSYEEMETVVVTGGIGVIQGTAENDVITIDAAGIVTVTNELGFNNVVDMNAFDNIVVNALGGDDSVTVAGDAPFATIAVLGGDNGTATDELNFIATGDVTVDLAARTISSGGPVVSFDGVEDVHVDVNGFAVDVLGTPADDAVTIKPDNGTVDLTSSGLNTLFSFTDMDNDAGDFQYIAVGGNDEVTVESDPASRLHDITLGATTVVSISSGAYQPLDLTGINHLNVNGGAGSDHFTVSGTGPIVFIDGGDPIGTAGDVLQLFANATIVSTPGPESDSGGFDVDGGQFVSFDHIEEVVVNDPVGSDLIATVMGTGADDDITAEGGEPNNVVVNVNSGPQVTYFGVAEIFLQGKQGDDDITIDVNSADLAVVFHVDGGLPTAGSDELRVTGADGDAPDAVDWSPSTGVLTVLGGPINVMGIETLIYDGESDEDSVTVTGTAGPETFVHHPAANVDAGSVSVRAGDAQQLGIHYEDLGGGGTVTVAGNDGGDTLTALGTTGSDRIDIQFTGLDAIDIDLTSPAGTHVDLLTTGVSNYNVDSLSGDDDFNVAATVLASGTFALHAGGPGSGSDTLMVVATAGAAQSIAVLPDAANPDDQDITGLGAVINATGLELLRLVGTGNDDTLTVNPGDGDNHVRVEAAHPGGWDGVTSDSLPTVEFIAMQNFVVDAGGQGSDVVTFKTWFLQGAQSGNYQMVGTGVDTLVIEGSDGAEGANDRFVVTNALQNPIAGPVAVTDTNGSGVTVTATGQMQGRVQINTLGGDDTVTVDNSGGLIDPLIGYDGGTGSDKLEATGTTPVNLAEYFPGPAVTEGYATYDGMTIDFDNLEPFDDNVIAASLVIHGTNANNAINFNNGLGGGIFVGPTGLVSVDEFETYQFNNKANLTLNGNAGDDVIHLNTAVTPVGLIGITVNGNDPTGGDRVVVNGRGGDLINVTPTATDGATITGAQGVAAITVTTSSDLWIQGAGGDVLTVTGNAATNALVHTPGADADEGSVRVDDLLPITYDDINALTLDGAGAGDDRVVYNGTPFSDTFNVAPGSSAIGLRRLEGFVGGTFVDHILVTTVNAEDYTLRGSDGDDVFDIWPQLGIDIRVEGDGPGASDVLNFNVDVADPAPNGVIVELDDPATPADLIVQTITQEGLGVVTLSGIETANIDAANNDLVVAGTRVDDMIQYTPRSTDSGTITAAGIETVFHFDNVQQGTNTFTITGGAGGFADSVHVNGTSGRDLIRVDSPNRTASVEVLPFGAGAGTLWRDVTLDDGTSVIGTPGIIESVTVAGGDGDDTFWVATAPALGNGLYVNVSGGEPQASDALVITNLNPDGTPAFLSDASDYVIVHRSRAPDAGNVIAFNAGVRRPSVSFENTEIVSANFDPSTPQNNRNNGDPNITEMGPDIHESNESSATAAYIGTGETLQIQNAEIFPGANEHPGVAEDHDYYRFIALDNGTLDFQVYFHDQNALVPGDGNIDIEVLDDAGNVIAGFGSNEGAGDEDERVRIPAIAGQTYVLHVFGGTADVINGYDVTVTNQTPPVPYDLELLDDPIDGTTNPPGTSANSDTGRSRTDNITYDNAPTIFFRLDDAILLQDIQGNDGTVNGNNPPDQQIVIPFNASIDPANNVAGFRVPVFVEGVPQQPGTDPQIPIGFAQPVAGVTGVYTFDFDDANNGAGLTLTDGSHFINAKVQMIDPSEPSQNGFGDRSLSLEILVDTVAPGATIDLIESSDSGMVNDDNVTRINQPAFAGVSEVGAEVRVYANATLVGVGTVAADGNWEVTVEPLDDGPYNMTVQIEDVAGNLSNAGPLQIWVDTDVPNTPYLDLLNDDGHDTTDDITGQNLLQFEMIGSDTVDGGDNPFWHDVKYRLYWRTGDPAGPGSGTGEVLVYDSWTEFGNFTTLGQLIRTVSQDLNNPVGTPFPDGVHNFKLEVEDRAGNISPDFLLKVTIDTVVPTTTIDILSSSDSGMYDDDNVTNVQEIAFQGRGETNAMVTLFAQKVDNTGTPFGDLLIIGTGTVGSDHTDVQAGIPGATDTDLLGMWEITAEPLVDGVYDVYALIEDWADNESISETIRLEVDTLEPNLPHLDLDEASDSGRHNDDNVTNDNTPSISLTTHDANADLHRIIPDLTVGGFLTDYLKYRVYDRAETGPVGGQTLVVETLLYNSAIDATADASSSLLGQNAMFTDLLLLNTGNAQTTLPLLADGTHTLKVEVEDRAGNVSHDFLIDLVIDTSAPPVTIVDQIDVDSGDPFLTDTLNDRITNDTRPTFRGTAEANAIVNLYVDGVRNALVDTAGNTSLTVAQPIDGDNALPDGQWTTEFIYDLNDDRFFANDGVREILVTATDLAGNTNTVTDGVGDANQVLEAFIDTQGPQVTDVYISDAPGFNLFTTKIDGANQGPTPAVDSLTIDIRDLPARQARFLHSAISNDLPIGLVKLVGDHSGVIA
ncbi:MAG: hypothetical protein HKN47_08330, partial [Pirellulaceae bacterium]|nr:hypothetical protein [Pirellulaceae bacterium]